jgi:predicted nuclease with RNAse H fold
MHSWGGADPGGVKNFGVCTLFEDGTFISKVVSDISAAIEFLGKPQFIGIDCPMWWSLDQGGGRSVDARLRRAYRIHPGTVQSVNSLKGAVLVQGILLAMKLREYQSEIAITETHPKAMLYARRQNYKSFFDEMGVQSPMPETEHEKDALVGAIVAREAALGRWTVDLASKRGPSELDSNNMWFGRVNYYWFESI